MGLSTKMCWDSVKHCLEASGAMTTSEVMELKPSSEKYATFIALTDPITSGASDVRRLPQGAILGFVDLDNSRKLIHATVSVGAGLAAGNKNTCLGIGGPIGWEILDLTCVSSGVSSA